MAKPEKTPFAQLLEDLNVERHRRVPPKPGDLRPRRTGSGAIAPEELVEFMEDMERWERSPERGGRLRVVNE
jgi:hypothetical protein